MKRSSFYILIFGLLALLAGTTVMGARTWDDDSRQRKADYIFLEAQNAYSANEYNRYIALIRRAHELDSANIDIAGEWGMVTLNFNNLDSVTRAKAYNYIRDRFLDDTTSYANGMVFSNVASHFNRIDDVVMTLEKLSSVYPAKQEGAESLAKAYVLKAATGDSAALDRALSIYRRLEDGAGKNTALTSQIVRALLLRSDTAAVENELSALMRATPQDSYAALYVGSTYDYLAQPDSALKYISLACALDSANGSAYLTRANFYRQRGDSAAFDREVFHALNSSDLEVDTKVEMLRSYVSELYTDTAQQPRITALFERLQQLHPGEADIHSLYSAYLVELKDYGPAAEQMSYAMALEPENDAYAAAYIQLLSLADEKEKMLAEAAEAQKRFPQNLYFPIIRASTYHTNGDCDRAIAIMDSVDISDILNPSAVSNFVGYKGDLLAAAGDTLAALETYEKAIDINPDNAGALNNAAYFMSEIQGADLNKALRYSSRSIKAEPENYTYLDTYAWLLFKLGDISLARQYIDATIRVYEEEMANADPDDKQNLSPDIYDHAGDIYYKDGDTAKAIEYWQKALDIDPDNDTIRLKIKHPGKEIRPAPDEAEKQE